MNRPVVLGCCLWITGYVLAMYVRLPWLSLTACVLLLCAAAAVYVFRLPARLPVCALLLVGAAMGYYYWNDQRNVSVLLRYEPKQELLDGSEVTLLGRIGSPVTVDGDRASFTLEAETIRFPNDAAFPMGGESVQVSLRLLRQEQQAQAAGWRRSDAIELHGTLRSPSVARNFGGFDYRRYLRLHRIHWLLTAKGADQAQVTPAPSELSVAGLLRWNDALRDFLGRRMDVIFPASQAGFMKSMLIGFQDDLDPARFQQFSELGLTHILAISGLNVAVFLGVCTWVMKKMRLTKETYLLISILLLPPYILLTGASPSIVRAGLMAMVALYAARRGIMKDVLHIMAIVAWVMLAANPYYLLDVGFQLSFLVTVGLIVGVQRVSRLWEKRIPSRLLRDTLALTLVSQLLSFPVSIYYFNQFSLLSWLANAVLVPVISMAVFPAGIAALAIGLVSVPAGKGVGWLLSWLNEAIFWTTDQMQKLRGFKTIWPSPSFLWIASFYTLLIILYVLLHNRSAAGDEESPLHGFAAHRQKSKRQAATAALLGSAAAFALLLYVGYTPERFSRTGLVQFIDVGQGDGILIRTPYGKHILVDGGGTLSFRKPGEEWKERKDPYEVGKKLLVPLLKKRGVHQLDLLVLTHEDADHSGGLQAVVEQLPVSHFMFNGTLKPNPGIEKLFRTAQQRGVPLLAARAAGPMRIDPQTTLQIIYPDRGQGEAVSIATEQNEHSVVFLLDMQGTRWLFTGDAEKGAEQNILDAVGHSLFARPDLPQPQTAAIDVLKVAHHGSKTSTTQEWLDYWKPRLAVISVGEQNTYGHPSPAVIERLEQMGAKVFRTDAMGEVQMEVRDGRIYSRMKLATTEQVASLTAEQLDICHSLVSLSDRLEALSDALQQSLSRFTIK